MTKTWFEKYTTWRRRSNWPIHPATEYAYHAGRKHQREAFRGEYAKIRKYYKEVDDWQDDLTEKFGVLTRERNEYKASCEALTQASKSLATERNYIQIQNGSLKNQIRILREMIVDLESKEPWWKFWKVDW